MKLLKSESFDSVFNTKTMNEGESADFANFAPKIGSMATSLKRSEKCQVNHL